MEPALGTVVLSCFSEEGTEPEPALGTVVLSGFSEEGAELQNMFWGLWSCLAWAVFSMLQPSLVGMGVGEWRQCP